MKKLVMLMVVVGMLISAGGCGWDGEMPDFLCNPTFTANELQHLQYLDQDFNRKAQEWRLHKQEYLSNHPEISSLIRQCILNGKDGRGSALNPVVLGMTKEQFLLCRSEPDSINHTVGSWGVHEQWVYGGMGGIPIRCYYFENGILTAHQS